MGPLDKWTEKLLDLSKRNKLLNFKDKINTVSAVFPDTETIFRKIISNKSLEIFDIDTYISKNYKDKNEPFILNLNESDPEFIKLCARIKPSQVILCKENANTIDAIEAVEQISKKSKDNIIESGINTLYMAFGFVKWTEPKAPNIYYPAPLLLLPISLINESVADPFVIKLYEDEIITNPTLAYKLKTESGIDLPQMSEDEKLFNYFEKIKKLLESLNWIITNEVKIGMFSFLKMNMYLDIKNNKSKLLSNRLTKALIYDDAGSFDKNDEEKKIDLSDLHNVVDADSSQTEAIKLSKSGASFVLQGPPGTGKSQTITNIVAECLYDNKKVLFVSEKLAALNVVYNNLKKANLDDFCLELHSHKTNKKEVISELNRVLKKEKISVSEKASNELDVLEKTKGQLDNYVFELHKKNSVINLSAYQLYGESAKVKDAADIDFKILDIENKDEKYLTDVIELLSKYIDYTATVGTNYKNNEWYGYINYDVSYGHKANLIKNLKNAVIPFNDLFNTKSVIEDKFGLDILTIKQFGDFNIYLNHAKTISEHVPNLYIKENLNAMLENFNQAKDLSFQIIKINKELDLIFDKKIYGYNFEDIRKNFSNHGRLFNRLKKTYKTDIKLLEDNKLKADYKLSYKKSMRFLDSLVKLKSLKEKYFKKEEFLKNCFADKYDGFYTKWDAAIELLKVTETCSKSGIDFTPLSKLDSNYFSSLKQSLEVLIKRIATELENANSGIKLLKKYFDESLYSFENSKIYDTVIKIEKCIDNIGELENWARFCKLLKDMEKADIKNLTDYFIEQNFIIQNYINIYKKQFFKQWIHYIISSNDILSEFNRVAQDRNINLFIEKDKLQFEISKAQINSKLSNLRPNLDIIPAGSQISVLLREGEKKRNLMPVRVLLGKTADITQLLKPCFLMSPLSVSTFLDADIKFDVVIFDEASQIFPEDALGSIYRSKQVIIVGDSKQMPPSNFFNAIANDGEFDDENENFDEDVKDYESILDICSTRFKQNRLKWHYRSRSEELIVFSNKNFYNYELVTFPPAKHKADNFGVEFYYLPDGIFDRKTKTNITEAEYMAKMVFDHFRQFPERSLGVVAFSQSQQEAIEKAILRLRKKDTSFEKFFKYDLKEPFFIKNLETVQGDERDTVILGIGYAKDAAGKFLHNFGPLNRLGGERRLNVAITRAKQNMKIVASILHSDIDLSRTKSEGARLLKEYLSFAQNGLIAPQNTLENKADGFGFETEVYDFLIESGFEVDKTVGKSGYQIDLAVKDPKKQEYVLAIECDGIIYRSQKSARDRDRLRKEVLERLGWNFYRIWSTDWVKNNQIEKQRLLEHLSLLLKDGKMPKESLRQAKQNAENLPEFMVKNNAQKPLFSEYVFADIPKLKKETKANVNSKANFQNFIRQVVSIESPLFEDWLLKRIVFMFDREKVTSAVKDEYKKLMAGITGIKRKNGFLYDSGQTVYNLKIPKNAEEQRDIKYISSDELEDGLLAIIKENIQLETEGLFKALAKYLKFNRMGSAIIEKLDTALESLKHKGLIEIDKTLVSLKR